MTKYREQMRQFMMTKKLEDSILQVLQANNVSRLYGFYSMCKNIVQLLSIFVQIM